MAKYINSFFYSNLYLNVSFKKFIGKNGCWQINGKFVILLIEIH